MGGEAAAHGESEIGGRNGGDRIGPWFFVTYGERLLLLRQKWNWYMPTRLSTLGNSQPLFYPYFTLILPLGWDYVREIASREIIFFLSTIETSHRLSSRLFGLQNSDYIPLNRQKFAKN